MDENEFSVDEYTYWVMPNKTNGNLEYHTERCFGHLAKNEQNSLN